jgi:hypothetical protein
MTALEYFWDSVVFKLSLEQADDFLSLFERAKEMEKQQIIDAYIEGGRKGFNEFADDYEQYYNETFNKS